MTCMHLLFGFSIFGLSLFLFHLNDVKTERGLNKIADFAWLEGKSRFLKFGDHGAGTEPPEISAFVFITTVRRKLLRELCKVLTGAHALENFFCLRAIILFTIELRMACEI